MIVHCFRGIIKCLRVLNLFFTSNSDFTASFDCASLLLSLLKLVATFVELPIVRTGEELDLTACFTVILRALPFDDTIAGA